MWVQVGTFTLQKSWLLTPAVAGTWFRLQHSQPPRSRRGVIAQASAYAPLELTGFRRLWAKEQIDVYQFVQPDCWSDRCLALRGGSLDVEYLSPWTVTIDVWDAPETFAFSGGTF